jgi:hypothetical protein
MGKANVQLVLNSRDAVSGVYNNTAYSAVGQNLIQGDVKDVSVAEVNFPYDIPNIQSGYNSFVLLGNTLEGLSTLQNYRTGVTPEEGQLPITIAPGFYTGSELATAINTAITTAQDDLSLNPDYAPTFSYLETTNQFTMNAPVDGNSGGNTGTPAWALTSPYTFPERYPANSNVLGKDLPSIMGFYQKQFDDAYVNADDSDKLTFSSGSAPLVFTPYVDICSPQLCKFQYFRDGSTTNLARRNDVICRLYVTNNIATQTVGLVDGTRPFIIERQFYNARTMRWTADNAIGNIDIQLFDDIGNPLQTSYNPRPFQITFNVKENDKDEGVSGAGRTELESLIRHYAPYKDKNTQAWNNLKSIH